MHPETHLATRDWRHLCRSPPCSPCFLHIKNLLVVVLDLFFIRVRPEDSQKTRPTAPSLSTVPVQVSDHFLHLHVFKVETGNLESTIQQHLSFPCSRRHCTSQTSRLFSRTREMVEFLPRLQLQRWTAEARDVRVVFFFGVKKSRFAVSLTAHASPAHSWSGFLRAWSKIGPFERSSSRCGQPMFWLHAHVKK